MPRPADPIAKPAAAQMKSTFGLATTNTAAMTAARPGVTVVIVRIQAGEWAERLRVSQRNTPNTMSAIPTTMRNHKAHGGFLSSPPSRLDTSTKIAVNAASPTTQPTRNARPVGFGRGVCSTSTAGMIESGERATTRARGMSSVSSEPQPAVTPRNVANHRIARHFVGGSGKNLGRQPFAVPAV